MENTTATDKLNEVGLGQQAPDTLTGVTAEKKAASFTPEEEAAARFIYLLPYIKKFGNSMGQKAVVRVLHELAQFPLNGDKPRFQSKQEEQLFGIFNEIYMTKSVILKYAMEQRKKESEVETLPEV